MYERKKREGIMLCYPFEEKRLLKWSPPYIIQPKYDGVRCRAVRVPNGKFLLLSSTEEVIFSVPHINSELDERIEAFYELDGELYCHGWSFEQINSVVSRTVNLHSNYASIEFHVFDTVTDDPQLVRLYEINHYLPQNLDFLKISPYKFCDTLDDILKAYKFYIALGYEGIIIRECHAPYLRRRSPYIMKFKPKKSDTYEIVGYKEEIDKYGNPKDRLGALICVGDDGTEFSVGSGLTDRLRHELWLDKESLVGCQCLVEYQHLTPGRGVPRFPIFTSIQEPNNE